MENNIFEFEKELDFNDENKESEWIYIIFLIAILSLGNNFPKEKEVAAENVHKIIQEHCENNNLNYDNKKRNKISEMLDNLFMRYCNA